MEDCKDEGLWKDVGESHHCWETLVTPTEPPATDLGPQTHKQTHVHPAGQAHWTGSPMSTGTVTALITVYLVVQCSLLKTELARLHPQSF